MLKKKKKDNGPYSSQWTGPWNRVVGQETNATGLLIKERFIRNVAIRKYFKLSLWAGRAAHCSINTFQHNVISFEIPFVLVSAG